MKALLLQLLQYTLRKLLSANAGTWADLKASVKRLDLINSEAESKHLALDDWLKNNTPTYVTPAIRRRLIQAAVLCVRIEEFLAVK